MISLNPIQGTRLDALWSALEQREDVAWQGLRPHDTPRFLESYRLAGSVTNDPRRTEPTLVRRSRQNDANCGTEAACSRRARLETDLAKYVLPAIWQLFYPLS